MLNTIYAGQAPLISNTIQALRAVSTEVGATIQSYRNVSAVQVGYFVPVQTGDHAFRINTGNGCYLALNGQILLNVNNFSGWANSANVALVAGRSYSISISVPIGANGITSLLYSYNGGTAQAIQNTQIYSTTDMSSNPLYNANAILQSLITSATPGYITPIANVLPTNVTANNLIATVPCPAVIPSVSGVVRSMESLFLNPVPFINPVTCYRDICVMPPLKDPPLPPPPPPTTSGVGYRGSKAKLALGNPRNIR